MRLKGCGIYNADIKRQIQMSTAGYDGVNENHPKLVNRKGDFIMRMLYYTFLTSIQN